MFRRFHNLSGANIQRLCLLLLFVHMSAKTFGQAIPLEELIAEQKPIISILSGHSPTPTGEQLPSRCKKAEKAIARKYLTQLFHEAGLKAEEQNYRMPNLNPLIDLLFDPFEGVNLYANIPATIPSNEYVLIGAHYDTELDCPGAIDNATGMVLAFSVAKRLAKLANRNKNVLLVFFDQEEEELIGSQAFANWIAQQKYELHSAHTLDMIGWDKDGDRAIELELPTVELETIYRKQAEPMGVPIYINRVNSTDHHSFRVLGYDATGITEEFANGDTTPFKDTYEDTFDKVNFPYLASTTALVYKVFEELITQ